MRHGHEPARSRRGITVLALVLLILLVIIVAVVLSRVLLSGPV
jgi:flagellar basal body-associated protein FliL